MNYTKSKNTYLATPKDVDHDRINLEVGDFKQPIFHPQVKIMRWDNEVNFSIRLKHSEPNPSISRQGRKVRWKGKKLEAHFYDLPIDADNPEGGYELEITLNERPETNIIEFTVNTKGLQFFYQGEVEDEEDAEHVSRPEHVVGSYAIYQTETKPNLEGGKQYGAGKVGHIFRPKIVDANGAEVWGKLNIDPEAGIMTVTIPDDFLATAAYPMRHASGTTIGYTTLGASVIDLSSSAPIVAVMASPYSAVTGDSVTQVAIGGNLGGGISTARTWSQNAIYSVSSGSPLTRTGQRAPVVMDSLSLGWFYSSTLNIRLLNGTSYCVAFGLEGDTTSNSQTVNVAYDAGSAPGRILKAIPPSYYATRTWGTVGSDSGRRYSVYATVGTYTDPSQPAAGTYTDIFTDPGYWKCPTGVSSVDVEVWGAGGTAPAYATGYKSGGGGGGGYAKKSGISVTPGTYYEVQAAFPLISPNSTFTGLVDSEDSWFLDASTVKASGGKSGNVVINSAANTGTGGAGGSSNIGDTTFNGGAGGLASPAGGTGAGGGGGGGGGSTQAGTAGATATSGVIGAGGAGGSANGGNGSDGTLTDTPAAGSVRGGGGGGVGSYTAIAAGGSGGRGEVRITYTVAAAGLAARLFFSRQAVKRAAFY